MTIELIYIKLTLLNLSYFNIGYIFGVKIKSVEGRLTPYSSMNQNYKKRF